jgi:hypothetical protein
LFVLIYVLRKPSFWRLEPKHVGKTIFYKEYFDEKSLMWIPADCEQEEIAKVILDISGKKLKVKIEKTKAK